jgi:hypothetical protein
MTCIEKRRTVTRALVAEGGEGRRQRARSRRRTKRKVDSKLTK